jgi:hypothetical protein
MGPEENKAVVRRFVEETRTRRIPYRPMSSSLVDSCCTFQTCLPWKGSRPSRKFPPPCCPPSRTSWETIDDLVAEGDYVVERMTLRGMHLGEFMGVAPTGKPVSWTAIAIYRLEEGRIVESAGRCPPSRAA